MLRDDRLVGRIAIYARISKEEIRPGGPAVSGPSTARKNADEDSGGSTSAQIYRCKKWLSAMCGDEAAKHARVFKDEGFSGKDTNRPGFQQLLREIRRGRVRMIVFAELSRISRSVRDFLALIDQFDRDGVKVVSLREDFNTSTPQGRLIVTILAALNEFEREQTALRTHLNMKARAEQGYWTGGTFPLGYARDPDRRGHLVVVEEEARIVREVFRVYLKTGSVPKTVADLKASGFMRPGYTSSRGRHHPAKHLLWDAVKGILANPTYAGLREVNRKHRGISKAEAADLPEADHYGTVEGVWKPIIDRETFWKVRDLRAVNEARNQSIQKPKRHDFVLTGVVYCADCRTQLEGASAKRHTYFYYQHPRRHGCSGCAKKAWPAHEIEDAVLDRLGMLADDDEMLDMIIASANRKLEEGAPIKEGEVATARGRVARLEAEVQSLVGKLTAMPGDQVPAMFWKAAQESEAALNAARSDLTRLEIEVADIKSRRLHAATYRNALGQFHEVYESLSPFDKTRLLGYLIERIEVGKDGAAMWLLGENPDLGEGGPNENRPDSGYCQGGEWLRLQDSNLRPSG